MVTIRPLVPSDIPDLIDLVTVSFADEYLAQGMTAVSLARQIRLITRGRLLPFRFLTRLAGIHWEMWVAEADGRTVGCGGFLGQEQMELSNLMVHPDWRCQGIGQALLKKRLERLQTLGYPLVTTTVLAHNAASLGNLHKQGFTIFDRYHILEKPLPLPPTPKRLTMRRVQTADRPFFEKLERDATSPERLRLQGSASSAYFPSVGTRLLNSVTGNRQQTAVLFKDDHPIGFSLVRAGVNQSKGIFIRPILPPRHYNVWYPVMLQQAASWLAKQGKERIQIAISAELETLVTKLLTDGWEQTQSWLRLVKYLEPKSTQKLTSGQD